MKSIKDYADEMRTMAAMLNEGAEALEAYHDNQMRSVLTALGLVAPPAMEAPSVPARPAEPELTLVQKVRKEYAELPPPQRTLESRQYLARKYQITEAQVSNYLLGPVQNGQLTRK